MLQAALLVLTFIENTPLQGSERMVVLSDLRRFGVCLEIVAANRASIDRHAVIIAEMPEAARWAWEFRQQSAACAWRNLGTALNKNHTVAVRLAALDELRLTVGDDAYFAGAMPPAIPDYGAFAPVKKQ